MVYGGSWGVRAFGLLWLLGGLLLLVLVVVLVVLAIRHLTRMNPPSHGPWSAPLAPPPPNARPEPLDILRGAVRGPGPSVADRARRRPAHVLRAPRAGARSGRPRGAEQFGVGIRETA
jgi:hypothetical protein